MLQAAVATRGDTATSFGVSYSYGNVSRRSAIPSGPAFHLTWSSVEFEGARLADDEFDAAVRQVQEAIKAGDANDKEELLIANFAPGVPVGSPVVTDLQLQIEEYLREAATRLGRDVPEMRLSLRGEEYDLRCYLGRSRPTDFQAEQEF